ASLREAIHELAGKPAFWLMTAGATIAAFCGYGISSFQSLFLVRTYEITAGQAAIWINTPVALSAAVGTFATGWLATRIYKKHPGAIAWVPAAGLQIGRAHVGKECRFQGSAYHSTNYIGKIR